jgi:hypothetical protein
MPTHQSARGRKQFQFLQTLFTSSYFEGGQEKYLQLCQWASALVPNTQFCTNRTLFTPRGLPSNVMLSQNTDCLNIACFAYVNVRVILSISGKEYGRYVTCLRCVTRPKIVCNILNRSDCTVRYCTCVCHTSVCQQFLYGCNT